MLKKSKQRDYCDVCEQYRTVNKHKICSICMDAAQISDGYSESKDANAMFSTSHFMRDFPKEDISDIYAEGLYNV